MANPVRFRITTPVLRRAVSTLALAILLLGILTPALDSGQLTCAWCHKAITKGQYYQIDGRYYHIDCYWDHVAPRCAVCGKPIEGTFITDGDKKYHEACYDNKVALRCDLCNAVIRGKYVQTFWGEHYCAHHQGTAPECTYCGRFLGDRSNRGGQRYPDGRNVCNICLKTAVNDEDEAQRIMESVRGRLKQIGIDVDIRDIPLHLVSRDELGRRYGGDMSHNSGFCQHDYNEIGGRVFNQRFQIFILTGMPRMHFITTLSHELMHVWQYQNCPLDNQIEFCEGSCNYAAWLVLRQIGGDKAAYQMKSLEQNQNPVYGGGFRRVKRLAEDRGNNGWLSTLQSHPRFPAGY